MSLFFFFDLPAEEIERKGVDEKNNQTGGP